jgi:hypothetical protein
MHVQVLVHDITRMLVEERIARSLEAYGARRLRTAGCPLERLARWIAARRRRSVLDPASLAR